MTFTSSYYTYLVVFEVCACTSAVMGTYCLLMYEESANKHGEETAVNEETATYAVIDDSTTEKTGISFLGGERTTNKTVVDRDSSSVEGPTELYPPVGPLGSCKLASFGTVSHKITTHNYNG